MSKRIVSLLLLLVTAVVVTACLPANWGGPDPCDGEGTLFRDDFSGAQNCGWAIYSRGGASIELRDEAMQLRASSPGQIWWTNPNRNFSDAIINVQAEQLGGPDDNAYGVICRYQSPENFYVFLISGDGYYAIGKYQTGSPQIQYLSGEGRYVASEAINQGQAVNRIRVSCVGNQLSLTVNGQPLETVIDPTFVTGDIGLAVTTFQPGTAVIQFNDLRVIAP
jgi:hypothetical protein